MKKIVGIIVALALVAIVGIGVGYYFAGGTNSKAALSEEEAQSVAVEDADLAKDEVEFTKTKQDRDDGRIQYDIEFIAKSTNTRYDYEIDAETGAILSVDRETGRGGNTQQPANNNTQNNAQANQGNAQNGPQAAGEITADEAKSIALNHAGVAEADAIYMDVTYDYDDGRTEWSVDFATSTTEYDYEINAADGSIMKSEQEPHNR